MTQEELRTKVCDIVSEMLDNPDECGIYPTTVCYDKLIALTKSYAVDALRKAKRKTAKLNWDDGNLAEFEIDQLIKEIEDEK